MAEYQQIRYERRGRLALLTLDRPDRLNAWTGTMEEEFIAAVDRTAADPELSVLVVTGAGRGFCAGADIGMFAETTSGGAPPQALESPLLSREGSPEVALALTRGKPAIAAINGPAIGIGLTMALACDVRLASERAKLSARFVKVGLTPECGSTRYLPLVAGFANALLLTLTGRTLDAAEAKERGLVERVVPHEKLLDEAFGLAEEIAANPPEAVWAAKRLLHENAAEADLRRVVSQESSWIREMRGLPNHAEAVQAFLEKRAPKFT